MKSTKANIFWKVKSRDKVSPARLFADSDRDGVPNVFDCRPFNKRRQDYQIKRKTMEGYIPLSDRIEKQLDRKDKGERKTRIQDTDIDEEIR